MCWKLTAGGSVGGFSSQPRSLGPPWSRRSIWTTLWLSGIDAKQTGPPGRRFAREAVRGGSPCGAGRQTVFGQRLLGASRRQNRPRRSPWAGRAEVECHRALPPVPACFMEAAGWSTAVEGRWKWPREHINVKEARICLASLKRLARSRANHGGRALSLTDNLVSCVCFDKGR